MENSFRIGIGYDVHRLVSQIPLILGGIKIEYSLGLEGHSDADVLIHAIMDGILGALALGDIGKLFPDNDPQYKNISSLKLLSKVREVMVGEGYVINNIDSIIIAERPKISPYSIQMREKIADTLRTSINNISIKATTQEGLGFSGRGEGIAAQAVVLLKKEINNN